MTTNLSIKDFGQIAVKYGNNDSIVNAYIANGHVVAPYVDDDGKNHGDHGTAVLSDRLLNPKSLFGRNLPADARSVVLTENPYFNYATLVAVVRVSAKGDYQFELKPNVRLNSRASKELNDSEKTTEKDSIAHDIMHTLADLDAMLTDKGLFNPITFLASKTLGIENDPRVNNDGQAKAIMNNIAVEFLGYTGTNLNFISLAMTKFYPIPSTE